VESPTRSATQGTADGAGDPRAGHPALGAILTRLAAGEGTFDRPPLIDVLLAVALALPAGLQLASEPFTPRVPGAADIAAGWVGWLLFAGMFTPLAWRRVAPTVTIALTGTCTAVASGLGMSHELAFVAVFVALYSVAAYGTRSDSRASLLVTLGVVGVSLAVLSVRGVRLGLAVTAVNVFAFVGVWAIGDRTRVRRELLAEVTARAEEAERSRDLAADLAVAAERARIARELHDVVAHAVSIVVVQAGAGRRIVSRDPGAAADALAAIEDSGRDALTELRRVVGVLRDPDPEGGLAPQPTVADLPGLVARLVEVGLPVTLTTSGQMRGMPTAVELSAYRIVQEALTNVLKHAGEVARVEVQLRYHGRGLTVTVVDDGSGTSGGAIASGAGLVGMRERAALVGGRLDAGPRPRGGFEVCAELPTDGRDALRAGEGWQG